MTKIMRNLWIFTALVMVFLQTVLIWLPCHSLTFSKQLIELLIVLLSFIMYKNMHKFLYVLYSTIALYVMHHSTIKKNILLTRK